MAASEGTLISSEAEHGRRLLAHGVTAYRWAALVWMGALAIVTGEFREPGLALVSLVVALCWTAWMTLPRRHSAAALWFELALAFALIVISGIVAPEGAFTTARPFFATAWPVAAVLAWGVAQGPSDGVLAATLLGAGLAISRSANGVPLVELDREQIVTLATGTFMFVAAGLGAGIASRLLARATEQFESVLAESARARQDSARLAEREALARETQEAVLHALAIVHRQGRELAANETVPGEDVARLVELAGRQEKDLRAMMLRRPETAPHGMASLRELLEVAAHSVTELPITVSAVGPIWMPSYHAHELTRAVQQALDNVVKHSGASRATLTVDVDLGWVAVAIQDDGRGFVYDEELLRGDRKAGMLTGMKQRVEFLGGRMVVKTAPGEGTHVELRVPLRRANEDPVS